MIYFTSDTHWYHTNIIKYCNRPFYNGSSEEMDNAMMTIWNKKISPIDTVYHLGDFAFTGNIEKIKNLLSQLNGNIHLIMGNHDYQNKFDRDSVRSLFKSTNDYLYIDVEDEEIGGKQGIFLCHYPMLSWNQSERGSWQLFGHLHTGSYSDLEFKNVKTKPTQYDVGVDNNFFSPLSYDEIKTIITKQCLKAK